MDIARGVLPVEKVRVLLVDDDTAVRRSLQLLLQANGYDVRAYAAGAMLLADANSLDAACLVADYRMDETDGIDTLVRLRAKGWTGPAILVTAFHSTTLVCIAKSVGFEAILEKPLRHHELVMTIRRLVQSGGYG